ncbi:unnamed protein product (macronuclear) [Paramecium tetraurelia]|uniref:Uncharacterized protein n=1 Tax=Paramecium tetraurelia TaxID=5888 RepID=A0CWG8_PARTE|nr:uncharacterized protein GSPATT00001338001 [Paramecium tetraurelia]CAK75135.1 unnamed protein product [Paramecium tetraurelia]|eukprot:XP_001442532.1 hypothetical protein (macronuclear) [Paramecium tetraurelia strain d4-2]
MTYQPTVYEQQLIRDQGEDFRIRVKSAIKKFDSIANFLKLSMRNIIKEMVKELLSVDDETLVNNFYFKYFTRYEDQHFRFMMQSLNFIFDQETHFDFNNDLNYKYIAIIYTEQIRNYLKDQNDKGLSRLWNKLNLLKKQKETDEVEEGFWDGLDTENCSQQSKNKKFGKSNVNENENEFCHTRKEMQLKDLLIQSLQTKLFQREQNLVQTTQGYLKELQSLREQLFRKNQTLISPDEPFEVSFMDFTEVLDANIKKLFTTHIIDLKFQFNNRIIDYIKLIQAQREEIKNYKLQIQKLNQQINNIDGPSELLKKLFLIDNNPYRIWKYIADQKGNQFFKEVFEQQKAVYGINYQELNKLLMTNKAFEREYQLYKEQILSEQLVFFERVQQEIEDIKKKYIRLEQEKQAIENQRASEKFQYLTLAAQYYDEKIKQEIEILNETKQQQLQAINLQTTQIDKIKIKFAFKLWLVMSKVHKNEDLMKILKENEYFDEKLKSLQLQNQEISQLLANEKKANTNLIAKSTLLELDLEKQKKDLNHYKFVFDDWQQQNLMLQEKLNQKEKEYQLLNSFSQKILRLIDSRLANLKPQDINLDDKSKEVVRSIMNSIKQLNIKSLRSIEEIKQQGQLNLEVYQTLTQELKKHQSTQTEGIVPTQTKVTESSDEQNKKANIIQQSQHTQGEELTQQQQSDQVIKKNQQQIKPKLIVNQPHDSQEEMQQQKEFEEQSTKLSPLKVLQNFDYKNAIPQKKQSPDKTGKRFQEYQDYQTDQVIQLLEVSEQVEQEQNQLQKKNQKRAEQSKSQNQNRKNCFTSQLQKRQDDSNQQNLMSSTRNSRSFRLRASSQNNNSSIPVVHEKLYADSQEKQERIKNLKENLELLEKNHWDKILDLFSQQPSGNYVLNKCIPSKIDEAQFQFLETSTYFSQQHKKYYNSTKSRTPNKEKYKSWIMKQTGCIDKMFETLNSISKPNSNQADSIINQSTLLPNHIFAFKKKS